MNTDRYDLHAFAVELRRQLTDHGFTVLAVTVESTAARTFVVYLHGLAGNEHHVRAFAFLAQPGEDLDVSVSQQTPAILLVRHRPSTDG